MLQLYLHFPFCKRKCFYCDFSSAVASTEEMAAYGALLETEIALAARLYGGEQVNTVFLGGGTPSLMPPKTMEGILRRLADCFSFAAEVEFTSEANPGALTAAWLEVLCRYGMNRLSLGVQAAQERLLQRLGRAHTFEDAGEAAKLARQYGIQNLNVDVMYGLPGQSMADFLDTLEKVGEWNPTHVSAYSLILEEGTPLHAAAERGELAVPDEDAAAEMAEQGARWLAEHGYEQYEISNFAKPGYACRHNVGYWQGAWYLGMGISAHSMVQGRGGRKDGRYLRLENTAEMAPYKALLESGKLPVVRKTEIPKEEAMFETLMLGLRMNAGVGEGDFFRRHGKRLTQVYGKEIEGIIRDGLGFWRVDSAGKRAFVLTERGLLLQNRVLLRFL